jgi:hypothetical protein
MKDFGKLFQLWVCSLVRFAILFAITLPLSLTAQGTLNALTYIPPSGGVFGPGGLRSYVVGGVGWSFVPTTDLSVAAIYAYNGTQVSFWQGASQIITNFDYTSSSGSFQPVTSLLLSAGQTYFVSAQNSDLSSSLNVVVYSSQGQSGLATFTNSPYITQFAGYQFSQSGQWSPNPAGDNSNFFYLGPNFEFQAVPEPTSYALLLLAIGLWCFGRCAFRIFLHDRKIFRPI